MMVPAFLQSKDRLSSRRFSVWTRLETKTLRESVWAYPYLKISLNFMAE